MAGFDSDVFGGAPEKASGYDSAIFGGQSGQQGAFNSPMKIGADAFPDALRETLKNASWFDRNLAGAGTAVTNAIEGTKQLFGKGDQSAIKANKIIREEAPAGAIAGDIGLTALPFGVVSSPLKAAAIGGAYGLSQPVDASNQSDIWKGKAINTGLGAASSFGGQLLANKMFGGVKNQLSAIEQKVQEKAAQTAASETASARGVAGNAAQNAYKQIEHLRELGANRALTPQESLVAMSLERELAEKALDKLLPAAAFKQSTSDAYKEAMATESARAAQIAAEKLSGNEIKQQIMARVKRYGPAVAGGMVGNMIFPGLGGAVGGAATGLTLRPAIRSMMNLSKNPAVQYGLLTGFNNSSALTSPLIPSAGLLGSEWMLEQ